MKYDKNTFPDRYSRDKRWTRVLPIPGRPIQAAELNEIQSIQLDLLKQSSNVLFADGSVVSGLRLQELNTTATSVNITISSGQIYINGLIYDVDSTSISLPISGLFNIGILLLESVITEEDDPSLRDPSKGIYNYGLEGAARLINQTTVVYNNPDSYVFAQVLDGNIIQKELKPINSLNTLLAQYTYDRAGNFCVRGFSLSAFNSSSRAVVDKAKYTNTELTYTKAKEESTVSLQNALDLQLEVSSLKQQLDAAIEAYNTSPISQNQLVVSDLNQRLANAEANYSKAATNLVSSQANLISAKTSFDKAQSLLTNKVDLSIAPGLAYVQGNRIDKPIPTILSIPLSLATSQVTGTTFTFSGSKAKTIRTLSFADIYTFADLIAENTLFRLRFSNLPYQSTSVNITVDITINSTLNNIEDLVNLIINEFNKSSDQDISVGILYSSSISTASTQLRSIIRSAISITRATVPSLIFTSTSNSVSNNQIEVFTKFFTRDSSNTITGVSQKIFTSVETSNLFGASTVSNYQLGFRPVAEVILVEATLEELQKPVVRSQIPGGIDTLSSSPITSIISVKFGSTNYLEGVDFKLINQSQLDWSLSGAEPPVGNTYYVSFLYKQPLTNGKDFTLDAATDEIVFSGGLTPAVGQEFEVTYSFYLSQAGTIALDGNGVFSYILSEPSANPLPPSLPDSQLNLGSFTIYADRISINQSSCRRLTTEDIYNLSEDLKSISKNLEELELDNKAYAKSIKAIGHQALGYFNDPVLDTSKLDLKNSNFTSAISPSIQVITSGYRSKDIPLKYVSGGTTTSNFNSTSGVINLFHEVPAISQTKATTSIKTSPSPRTQGKMFLSTQILFLNTNSSKTSICDTLSSSTSSLSRLTDITNSNVIKSISSTVKNFFRSISKEIIDSFNVGHPISALDVSNTSFIYDVIQNCRALPATISVSVIDLEPNSDGYQVFLSGKRISNFLATNDTPLSTAVIDGLRAKSDGTLSFTFTLPPDTTAGTYLLEVISRRKGEARSKIAVYNNLLNQIVVSSMFNWGLLNSSISSSQQLPLLNPSYAEDSPNITDVIIDGTSPFVPPTYFPSAHSAINQTIQFSYDFCLTSLNLYLKSIPSNASKLRVYIKSATEQYPCKTILSVAEAATLNVSNNGTIPTLFTLKEPLLVKAGNYYSISIEAQTDQYEFFVSKLGDQDLSQNITIGNQLFIKGELFTSSEGITLQSVKDTTLTFSINRADFYTNDTVDLGTYGLADSFINVTHFCLNTRDVLPKGEAIVYKYSISGSADVIFQPNQPICLPYKTDQLKISAKFISETLQTSALINLSGSSVSLYSSNLTSQAISIQSVYPEGYKNVDIILQQVTPSNTSIYVFYSPTDGFDWEGPEWFLMPPSSSILIDPVLNLYETTYSIRNLPDYYALSLKRTKFRYKLSLSSTDNAKQPIVRNVMSYVW